MKKHRMDLSYADLHAIKHALEKTILEKKNMITDCNLLNYYAKDNFTDEQISEIEKDIKHESGLLERLTERIEELKDKYKIEV